MAYRLNSDGMSRPSPEPALDQDWEDEYCEECGELLEDCTCTFCAECGELDEDCTCEEES
jgi:hypothetical protein